MTLPPLPPTETATSEAPEATPTMHGYRDNAAPVPVEKEKWTPPPHGASAMTTAVRCKKCKTVMMLPTYAQPAPVERIVEKVVTKTEWLPRGFDTSDMLWSYFVGALLGGLTGAFLVVLILR